MDNNYEALVRELYSQLNGDARHDGDVLMAWAERFRGDAGAKLILAEIGRLLYFLDPDGAEASVKESIDKTLRMRDGALSDARRLSLTGRPEAALEILGPWMDTGELAPPSDDFMWMDFSSFLDGLLFQDYFEDEIAGREVRRHPLRPGALYYTSACLQVELGRYDEALDTLDSLIALDPVCPLYLFELTDTLKRLGRIEEARNAALWALQCVSNDADAARCYRDLGYCLGETGAYDDAAALYQLSVRFHPSPVAEGELRWLAEKSGAPSRLYGEAELLERCAALDIPVGVCDTVKHNLELLNGIG